MLINYNLENTGLCKNIYMSSINWININTEYIYCFNQAMAARLESTYQICIYGTS